MYITPRSFIGDTFFSKSITLLNINRNKKSNSKLKDFWLRLYLRLYVYDLIYIYLLVFRGGGGSFIKLTISWQSFFRWFSDSIVLDDKCIRERSTCNPNEKIDMCAVIWTDNSSNWFMKWSKLWNYCKAIFIQRKNQKII